MAQEKKEILKTKDGQEYQVESVYPDGECAYVAYGTTRAEALDLIKQKLADPATKQTVISAFAPLIKGALIDSANPFFNNYIANPRDQFTGGELQGLQRAAGIDGSPSAHVNDKELEQYLQNEKIVEKYIDFDIGDKNKYGHSGVLRLLATLQDKELHIWQKNADGVIEYLKNDNLEQEKSSSDSDSGEEREVIHLFFTKAVDGQGKSESHYNKLKKVKKNELTKSDSSSPQPQPQQPQLVASPSPSPSSSSSSSSTSSTPPSPTKGKGRPLPVNRTSSEKNGSPSSGSSSSSSSVFSPYPSGSSAVFKRFKKSGAPSQSSLSPSVPFSPFLSSSSPLSPPIQQKKVQVRRDEDEDEVSGSEIGTKGYASQTDNENIENEGGVGGFLSDAEEGSSIDSEELPSEIEITRAFVVLSGNLKTIEKWLNENKNNNQDKIQKMQLGNYLLLLTLVQDVNNPFLNQLIEIVGDELKGQRCFGQKFDDASKTLAEILENSIAARLEVTQALQNDKNKNEFIEQQNKNLEFAALVFRATNPAFSEIKNSLLEIEQDPDDSKSFFGKETTVIQLNFNYIREAAQADELIKARLINANAGIVGLNQECIEEITFLQALQKTNREAIDRLLKEETVERDKFLLEVFEDTKTLQLCFGEDANWIAVVFRYQYLKDISAAESSFGYEINDDVFQHNDSFVLANEIISKPEFGDADDELLKIINNPNACEIFFEVDEEEEEKEDKITVFALKLRAKKLKDLYKDRNKNAAEILRIQKENLDMAKQIDAKRSEFPDAYKEILTIINNKDFGVPLFFPKVAKNSQDEAFVADIILEDLLEREKYSTLLTMLNDVYSNNKILAKKMYYGQAYKGIPEKFLKEAKNYDYDFLGRQDELKTMTANLISKIGGSELDIIEKVDLKNKILKEYRYSDELNLLTQAIKNYHQEINENFRYVDSDREGQLKRLLNLKTEYRVDGPKSIREVKNKLAFLQELRKIQEEIERVQEPKGQYVENPTTGKKVFKSELWKEIDSVIQKCQDKNYDFITAKLWPSELNEEKSAYFKLFDDESKYNLFVGTGRNSSYQKHQYEDGCFLAKQFLDNQNEEGFVFLLRDYQKNQYYLLGITNALIDGLKKSTIPVNAKTANIVFNLLGAIEKSGAISAYKLDVFSAFLNAAKPIFSDSSGVFEDKIEMLGNIDKAFGAFGEDVFLEKNQKINASIKSIIDSYAQYFGEKFLDKNEQSPEVLLGKVYQKWPNKLVSYQERLANLFEPYRLLQNIVNLQQDAPNLNNDEHLRQIFIQIIELTSTEEQSGSSASVNLSAAFFEKLKAVSKSYFMTVLSNNDTNTLINLLNGKPNIATGNEIKEWVQEYLETKNKVLLLSDYQCLIRAFAGRKNYEPLLKTIKRLSPVDKLKNKFLKKVNDMMGDKAKELLSADSLQIDELGKLAKEIDDVATRYPGLANEVKVVKDQLTKQFYDVYAKMLECRLDVVEDPVVVVIDKKNQMPQQDMLEPNKLYVYEEINKNKDKTIWYRCKTQKGLVFNKAINRDNLGYDLCVFQEEDNDASAYAQLTNTEETKKKFIADKGVNHQPTFIRLNTEHGPAYFLYQNNDVRQVHDSVNSPVFENAELWNSNQPEARHVRIASVGKYKDIYAQLKDNLRVDNNWDAGDIIKKLKENDKSAQQSIIALARASGHFAEIPAVRPDSYRLEQRDPSKTELLVSPSGAGKSKNPDESEKLSWNLSSVNVEKQGCDLFVMQTEPLVSSFPPIGNNICILLQSKNGPVTAAYFVDRSEANPVIRKLNFSEAQSVSTLTKALFPQVKDNVYTSITPLSKEQREIFTSITGQVLEGNTSKRILFNNPVSISQIPGMVEVLKSSSTVAYSPNVKKHVTDCLTMKVRSTDSSFIAGRAEVMAKVNQNVIAVLNPESTDLESLNQFEKALAEYPKEYFEAMRLLNKFDDYEKIARPYRKAEADFLKATSVIQDSKATLTDKTNATKALEAARAAKEKYQSLMMKANTFTENDYIQLVELLKPDPVPKEEETEKPSQFILLEFVIKRYLVEKREVLPDDPNASYSLFRSVMLAVQKGQRFNLNAHLDARRAILSKPDHRHHNEVVTLAKHYDYENYKKETAVKTSVENKIKMNIKDILEAKELHKLNKTTGKVIHQTSPFALTQIAKLEKLEDFFGNDEGQKELYLEAVKAMRDLEAYIQPFLLDKTENFAYQDNFHEFERLSVYMAQRGVFNFDGFNEKKPHPEAVNQMLSRFGELYNSESVQVLQKLKLIIETRALLLHNVMNLKIDEHQNKKHLAYYQLGLLSTREISSFFTKAYDHVEQNKAEIKKTTQSVAASSSSSSSTSTSTSTSSPQQKPKAPVVYNQPEYERREYWLCLVSYVKMGEKTGTQLFCENYLSKLSVKEREAFFEKVILEPFSFEREILNAIKTDEDKNVIIKVYENMIAHVEFSKAKNFTAIAGGFENTVRLRELFNVSPPAQNSGEQVKFLNQLLSDIAKLDTNQKDVSSIKTRIAGLMTNGSLGSLAYVLSDFYQYPERFFTLFCPTPPKKMSDLDSFVCGIISREDLWNRDISNNQADKYMDCYKVMVEKMLYGVGNMEIALNNFRTLSEAKKKFDEMNQNSKITPGSFGTKLFATQCIGGVLPESEGAFFFERDKREAKKIIAEKAEELKSGTNAVAQAKNTFMLEISINIGRAKDYKELQKVFSDAREGDIKLEPKAKCLTTKTLAEFEKAENIAQRFERDKSAAKAIIAAKVQSLVNDSSADAKAKHTVMLQISAGIDRAENYEELQKVFSGAREANKQFADREFEKAENIAYQCLGVKSQSPFSPSRSSSTSSSSYLSPLPKTQASLMASVGSPIAGLGASSSSGSANLGVSEEPSTEFKALIADANKILSEQRKAISVKKFSLNKTEDDNKVALLERLEENLKKAKDIKEVNTAFDVAKNATKEQKKVLDEGSDTRKKVEEAQAVFDTMRKLTPVKKQ